MCVKVGFVFACNVDFRPVMSDEDVFFGVTADVVTCGWHQGSTGFSMPITHQILQKTVQDLPEDFVFLSCTKL